MIIRLLSFGLIFLNFSCGISKINYDPEVNIQNLLMDKISIRAICIDETYLWFAGNNNKYGKIDIKSNEVFMYEVKTDSLKFEYRSIAQNKDYIFLLNVGNPANLIRISKKTNEQEVVYEEYHESVFYDSMHFKNELNGMAMGDPIEDVFSIITTNDGGKIWKKLDNKSLPKLESGEAAFAASNTNLIYTKSKIFIVSGGKKARVFVSDDFGFSWQVYNTPIIQGETMTGIFSADFYNDNIGFITGGNYEKPEDNLNNKAITFDGGKTWKLVANGDGFGYGSCIQFVPKSKGKALVSVGAMGIYFSNDFGNKWKKIAEDKNLFTLKFLDSNTFFAAGNNKIIRIDLNKKSQH